MSEKERNQKQLHKLALEIESILMPFTATEGGEGWVCPQSDMHISQEFYFVPVKYEKLVNTLVEMLNRWLNLDFQEVGPEMVLSSSRWEFVKRPGGM